MLELVPADTEERIRHARELFAEYVDSLDFSIRFQSLDEEIAQLPGPYAPPDGRLLLALWEGQVAGCVALRKLEDGICEMKRMYVRPAFRGRGIGRRLADAVIDEARAIGYRCMRLDSVDTMTEAITLYRSLGFQDCDPYCYNPLKGAVFMELALR